MSWLLHPMWIDRLRTFAAALWWGSLSTLGLLVVPMLFAKLASPAMAGNMAAQLFSAQAWVSVVCGVVLLLCMQRNTAAAKAASAPLATMLIVAGLLLAVLVEFAVAPRIIARENLKLWHSVGSGMYLGQWLCAGALVWLLPSRATQQNATAVPYQAAEQRLTAAPEANYQSPADAACDGEKKVQTLSSSTSR